MSPRASLGIEIIVDDNKSVALDMSMSMSMSMSKFVSVVRFGSGIPLT